MPKIRKKTTMSIKYIVVFSVIVVLTMYVYGMANIYFPGLISIGAGQYIDVSSGITFIGLLVVGLILSIYFKRELKKISNLKKI